MYVCYGQLHYLNKNVIDWEKQLPILENVIKNQTSTANYFFDYSQKYHCPKLMIDNHEKCNIVSYYLFSHA